jgi:hypothetical protein
MPVCLRAWVVTPVKCDGKATLGIASGQAAEDGDPQAEKDPDGSHHRHGNPEVLPIAVCVCVCVCVPVWEQALGPEPEHVSRARAQRRPDARGGKRR